jgi:cytochrome c2
MTRYKLAVAALTLGLGWASGACAADVAAGKQVFQQACSICHSVQAGQNKIGPSLFGVAGRKSGTVEGYNYSPANVSDALTWDPPTLDRYLAAPRTVVPGTKMTYGGLKDDEKRANLVAYLATLK